MSALAAALLEKIKTRRARTGVVGLGYVGLPLAVELAKAGFHATGIDLDDRKVQAVNEGRSYIPDVSTADVKSLEEAGKLDATTDFAVVKELDTINICVPTPLRKTKDPDMSYIVSAVEAIAEHLHPGMLVVPRVDDLPGHDRGSGAAAARSHRARRPARISSWRSRPSASIRATRRSRRTTCRKSSAA